MGAFLPSLLNPFPRNKIKWKQIKNSFSIIKTVLEIIISFYNITEKYNHEQQVHQDLKVFANKKISWDSEAYVLVREMIMTRREKRIHMVEASIYLLRYFMLTVALKLPGAKYLSPIFVSLCGLS